MPLLNQFDIAIEPNLSFWEVGTGQVVVASRPIAPMFKEYEQVTVTCMPS